MDEDKMKRALDTVDSLARSMREGREIVADLQRHQDKMVIWIIGLAGAAAIGLPAMYNNIPDMKNAPRWALAIPIGFFVFAVIFGVVVRLLLLRLMQVDAVTAYMKVIGWEALRFRHPEDEAGRKRLLQDALAILEERDPKISAQTGKVKKINRCIEKLELLPFVFFAVGVIFAAILAVCPPLKCGALPW